MSHAKAFTRISAILLIVPLSACTWQPNNREMEEVCQTTECRAKGEDYKNNMDTGANPCQDFYTFTCGNWHKNHADPKYAAEWNVIDVMYINFLRIMQKTLESYHFQADENILFHKAKEVYETCIKIPEYPRKEANEIACEITKIHREQNSPLWDLHLKYLKLSGESAFFRFKIMANIPSKSIPMVMIMEPSSAYGSILHEETWKPEEKQAYTNFLFLIIRSLKLTGSEPLIKEKIEKVFEFRKKLDQIIKQNSRERPDSFNPLTERDFELWFLNTIRDKTQDMHWVEIVEVLLQNMPLQMRQTQKVVAVRQRKYFLDLMHLFENVPEEVLGDHLKIYFVERHLKLTESMFNLLEKTSVEPHGLFHYIRLKYKERYTFMIDIQDLLRWQTCIENHNMNGSLEKLLFHKWFPKEYTEIIHELISKIKIAIEKQMTNSKWLDQAMREKTMGKLNRMGEWIGFPPWVTGSDLPREHLRSNAKEILTPNAALYIRANFLYIHAPLLLPPVFSPTIAAVYNYAGIGTSLGHEMYHVMDNCGRYQDGDWNTDWWSPKTRARCLRRMKAFVTMFNKITDKEFKDRYNEDVQSDTTSSLAENFPDVMGLEAAYNAYKALPSKEKSVCQTLPNFENYNCDQMFYIAFANTYCGQYTKKSARDKLDKWDHSIDSVRINGAVAQMQSFGRLFGCPVGSQMNPQEKLDLWK